MVRELSPVGTDIVLVPAEILICFVARRTS